MAIALPEEFGNHLVMSTARQTQTISDFLANTVARRGAEPALGFVRDGELWWRTWRQVFDEASQLAATIQRAGIESGDRVAHVSENRYEWIITDLAMHLAGAVHVPIHVTLSGEQIAAQISDSGSRLVFVSSDELLSKFQALIDPSLPILIHDRGESFASAFSSSQPPAPSPQPPESLATILYTSGTTGRPRGVMLSHRNLASNAAASAGAFDASVHRLQLNILPLSHIYARTCDLYIWVYVGCRLVLAESRETLARDCQLVRPTMLNAVPFVYQRIADRIRAAVADGAQQTASLRAFFGDEIEILFSGGAPLAPDVGQWFADRGLPVLAGYGLTESSPVISVSTPAANRPGASGRALSNVEIRIADDGEILTRGPHVMLGYWQDEEATVSVVRDGWLHTGDLGYLDANNYLYINGRKKELIVFSTGKKAHPTHVESLLTASPLIDQAVVFGEGRPFLVALIIPAACGLASDEKKAPSSEEMAHEITRCLRSAAHEEQVRKFLILDCPFSIDRGELTAKLSVRRTVIADHYNEQLARLYEDAAYGINCGDVTGIKQAIPV